MSNNGDFFSESKQKVEDYIKDRLLLIKLEVAEKTSRVMASMITGLLVILFAFFIIFFLSLMAGYLLGELIHHIYWGFGIVSGVYVIALIMVMTLGKNIIEKRIARIVIDIFFDKEKRKVMADDLAAHEAVKAAEDGQSTKSNEPTHE